MMEWNLIRTSDQNSKYYILNFILQAWQMCIGTFFDELMVVRNHEAHRCMIEEKQVDFNNMKVIQKISLVVYASICK